MHCQTCPISIRERCTGEEGEILCTWNLRVDSFAQRGVDKTESSSRVTDTSVTDAFDDFPTYNGADSVDLPESAIVNNGSVEDVFGSKVSFINVTYI
jgi:hypothetical protein